jgi:hypothetical protein
MENGRTEKTVFDTTPVGAAACKKRRDVEGITVFHVDKRAGAKAVLESEEFRAAGGVAVFRQSIVVVNVGIFIALLGLLAFIPAKETPLNLLLKLLLIVGMGGAGLYFILDGLVSRVYLEPERLVYRNFCGAEKAIRWQDIRKVKTVVVNGDKGKWEYLLVSGDDMEIKITRNYIAFSVLKNEIDQRRKQERTAARTAPGISE